jgi:hypothetical protein
VGFGENDAAIAAYRKVTPPEGLINPIGTYNLAQTRLKRPLRELTMQFWTKRSHANRFFSFSYF